MDLWSLFIIFEHFIDLLERQNFIYYHYTFPYKSNIIYFSFTIDLKMELPQGS